MKSYYYFILCLLLGISNGFSQNSIYNSNTSEDKFAVELMALDSITYSNIINNPIILKYDSFGNLIFIKDEYGKYEYSYNSNRSVNSILFHIWDYNINSYRLYENTEFGYDNSGNRIFELISVFIDSAWYDDTKTIMDYSNNLLLKETYYLYDKDSNSWLYSGKSVNLYNQDNNLISISRYFMADTSEILSSKQEITYDENNNIVFTLNAFYAYDSTLISGQKSYFTYNRDNLPIESLYEIYSASIGLIWKPVNKSEYTYNSNNLRVSSYCYKYLDSVNWKLNSIDSVFYDNNLNQVEVKTYSEFYNTMLCNKKYKKIFNYNYNKDDILKLPKDLGYMSIIESDKHNNMLTNSIFSISSDPSQEYTWEHDTINFSYSSKTIYVSLPENIRYDDNKFMVYPNPAVNQAAITVNGISQEAEISIMDIQGKIIKRIRNKPIDNNLYLSIDVSNLNKGIYIINIRSEKYSQTKKLIVN